MTNYLIESQQEMSILRIPVDVLNIIMSYLTPHTCSQVSQCCKQLHKSLGIDYWDKYVRLSLKGVPKNCDADAIKFLVRNIHQGRYRTKILVRECKTFIEEKYKNPHSAPIIKITGSYWMSNDGFLYYHNKEILSPLDTHGKVSSFSVLSSEQALKIISSSDVDNEKKLEVRSGFHNLIELSEVAIVTNEDSDPVIPSPNGAVKIPPKMGESFFQYLSRKRPLSVSNDGYLVYDSGQEKHIIPRISDVILVNKDPSSLSTYVSISRNGDVNILLFSPKGTMIIKEEHISFSMSDLKLSVQTIGVADDVVQVCFPYIRTIRGELYMIEDEREIIPNNSGFGITLLLRYHLRKTDIKECIWIDEISDRIISLKN